MSYEEVSPKMSANKATPVYVIPRYKLSKDALCQWFRKEGLEEKGIDVEVT